MKGVKAFTVFMLLLTAFFPGLPAQTFLEQMRAKITASRPFKMDFTQQVFVDGEMTVEESGTIVFADRTLVKWQYLRPDEKTFILENGSYQFYDRENNQLLKGKIDPSHEQVIWDLLCSPHPGQASRWEERTRTIRLSVDAGADRQELKIKIGPDFLPERVEQSAANEVTTVYTFRNYRTRVTLAAGEFSLPLPGDVEIIED